MKNEIKLKGGKKLYDLMLGLSEEKLEYKQIVTGKNGDKKRYIEKYLDNIKGIVIEI